MIIRPVRHAVEHSRDPIVAGHRFNGGNRQSGCGERFARRMQLLRSFGRCTVQKLVFQIAVAVQ